MLPALDVAHRKPELVARLMSDLGLPVVVPRSLAYYREAKISC